MSLPRFLRSIAVAALITAALIAAVSLSPCSGSAAEEEVPAFSFAAPPGMFFVGEELEYEVSYALINLGTVRIQILDMISKNGETVYRAKAYIDSYSGVPFVSLHYVFYSEMASGVYSVFFSGYDTKDPQKTIYADYCFDYAKKTVTYEKGIRQRTDGLINGSETINTTYQDGLSLFFFARANARSQRKMNVPTYVNEKKVNTYINFMNKVGATEIDAFKYPVRTVELDGTVDFVGIFGLTGGYRGWFSDDEAAIPIVAKMKVLIGSIHIELKKWNRPGWVPPKADT